jgi:hypothetical protein
MHADSRSTVCSVSTYDIDLQASNEAGFVLAKHGTVFNDMARAEGLAP